MQRKLKTMNCSELKMGVVSDIHLGHPRNSARDIVKNLIVAFPDNAKTADLDILYLAGDVFDRLLSLPHDDVGDIDMWFVYLLRLCAKHDIVLRILEGTPSHDWKQSNRFCVMEKALNTGVDMQYVQKLSIEYMERFDIHILYVPDEWQPETGKTYAEVVDLMKAKGLEQVDYAIMHGHFEYQLPKVASGPRHDSAKYLALVKELIFIGHDHHHTSYERIHAQGSFDRLTHGEEESKGHLRATVRSNGERNVVFVENTGAKKFITIDCRCSTVEETLVLVETGVKDLPIGSYVRIRTSVGNPVISSMEILIRRWPLFQWSCIVKEEEAEPSFDYIDVELELFTPVSLTSENLGKLLLERIAKHGPSELVLDTINELLEEIL